MNRNIILILILLIAGAAAFFIWKTKKDPSSSFDRADSNFRVEDINTIGRIIITNKEGDRSDLKRVGDHWTINDINRARQTNIDHLLKGISRQDLEYIPNKAATQGILNSMAVNGIHVEIFDNAGKQLVNYYVGGVTQDERGTFFLKEGSTQPYTLREPGFEGGLRARYALRPIDWRDVRFWIEDTQAIDTLKVDYPKQRQHSFVIYKKGNDYGIEPLFPTTVKLEGSNPVRIKSYLTTLSQLACENFLNDSPDRDSIMQMVPFVELEMIYKDKSNYLRFYPVGEPVLTEGSTDVPRYFIDYTGRDFMIAQSEVIKGAFRSYSYFFE